MTDQTDQGIERGAAEDNAGAPLTESDIELSRRAPSEPAERDVDDEEESGSSPGDNS
jgi:hypothetical protein